MEQIINQIIASFNGNFFEILAATAFLYFTITGNKTEAQKTAKRIAKLTKKRDKHIEKAEKENKELNELKGVKDASGTEKA